MSAIATAISRIDDMIAEVHRKQESFAEVRDEVTRVFRDGGASADLIEQSIESFDEVLADLDVREKALKDAIDAIRNLI